MIGLLKTDQELDELLASCSDPVIVQAGRYWKSKRTDGRMPARRDIDPIEIPALLPYFFLIEISNGASGYRYRFRLIGTKIVQWAGRDATGRFLDELSYGIDANLIAEEYANLIGSKRPRYDERNALWPNKDYNYYRRLVMPLSNDGEKIDMMMGVLHVVQHPSH